MSKHLILAPVEHTAEIFQSLDIKFALLHKKDKSTFEQVHTPIKCRDFLGDCIWSKETKKKAGIYGFYYDYKTKPYSNRKLYISMKFPTVESMGFFMKNFWKVYHIEEKINIKPSKWYLTDVGNTIIVEADKVWLSAQWKISLYTFYLKLISYKEETCLKDPENGYYETLKKGNNEEVLLSKVNSKIRHIHKTISEAHNYSGFVSAIKGPYAAQKLHSLIFSKETV